MDKSRLYKDFKLIFTNDNDRPILAKWNQRYNWDGQGSFYQIPVDIFTDSDPSLTVYIYSKN